MKKPIYIYTSLIAAFFTVALFTSYSSKIEGDSIPETPILRKSGLGQVVQSIDLNRSFNFAGENMPTDNFDVRERLDREFEVNSYWHSSTMQNLKLSARYFPVFERIFAEYGIPGDFKYLAVAESSLRHPTSPAGARGIWQFMEGTAEEYGLEVNSDVDERLHVEKVTEAAAKYLKKDMKNSVVGLYLPQLTMQGKDVFQAKWKSNVQLLITISISMQKRRVISFAL